MSAQMPLPVRQLPADTGGGAFRRWLVGIAAGCTVLLVAGIGLIFGTSGGTGGGFLSDPAARLAAAPAVRVSASFVDNGHIVSAALTVAQSGYATGRLVDADGGTAQLRATTKATAIRGDKAWWLDRAPGQTGVLVGKWVQPGTGASLPVQVVQALRPKALAGLVSRMTAGPKSGAFSPGPATVTDRGWTLRYDRGTGRIGYLAGPITAGRLVPALYDGSAATRVSPAVGTGPAGGRYELVQDSGAAYMAAAPEPEGDGAAQSARDDATTVLPDPAAPGTSTSPPPEQKDEKANQPTFEATLNATECDTPECGFSATVTNAGTAAGKAVVVLNASPGMSSPYRTEVGPLAPGADATVGPVEFPNPAPEPTAAQPETSVTVEYSVAVYWSVAADASGGTASPGSKSSSKKSGTEDPYVALSAAGLNPTTDESFNSLPADEQYEVAQALNNMVQAGVPPEQATNTFHDAVDKGLLNALVTFAATDGLQNWQDLPKKFNEVPAPGDKRWNDRVGYLREVEQARRLLQQDPNRKVILDGEYEGCNADVIDVTGQAAYQIKAITGGDNALKKNMSKALKQLNGEAGSDSNGVKECTPPGFSRVARIELEGDSPFHEDDRGTIAGRIAGIGPRLCGDDGPRVDTVQIVTGQGLFEWKAGDFGELGGSC